MDNLPPPNGRTVPNSPSSDQSNSGNSPISPSFGANPDQQPPPQYFLLADGGFYGNSAIPIHNGHWNGQPPPMNLNDAPGMDAARQSIHQRQKEVAIESELENDIKIDYQYEDEEIKCEDLNLFLDRKEMIKKMSNKIAIGGNGAANGGKSNKRRKVIIRCLNVASTSAHHLAIKKMQLKSEKEEEEEGEEGMDDL